MNIPEAYLDISNKEISLNDTIKENTLVIGEVSILVSKHVAYLLNDESIIDPREGFEVINQPVILSEIAYSKILQARVSGSKNTNIDLLILRRNGSCDIKKINTQLLHLTN